jgi:hypothetical protein
VRELADRTLGIRGKCRQGVRGGTGDVGRAGPVRDAVCLKLRRRRHSIEMRDPLVAFRFHGLINSNRGVNSSSRNLQNGGADTMDAFNMNGDPTN